MEISKNNYVETRAVRDWHLHKWNITFTSYAYWQEMGWETRWRYYRPQGLPNPQAFFFFVAKFFRGRQTVSRCSCSDRDRLFITGSQVTSRRFLWWPKLDVFQPEAGPHPGVLCGNRNRVFFSGSQTISRCFCGNQSWVVFMGSQIISSHVFADQNRLIFKDGWTISGGLSVVLNWYFKQNHQVFLILTKWLLCLNQSIA